MKPPAKTVQYMDDAYLERCRDLTPLQILQFIEDFRQLHSATPSPSKLISMKIPENLLQVFRRQSELEGVPYQTRIKQLMIEYLDSTRTQ